MRFGSDALSVSGCLHTCSRCASFISSSACRPCTVPLQGWKNRNSLPTWGGSPIRA